MEATAPSKYLILSFPYDLMRIFCTEWITLPEVAKIDSAFCCHQYRHFLLNFYLHPRSIFTHVHECKRKISIIPHDVAATISNNSSNDNNENKKSSGILSNPKEHFDTMSYLRWLLLRGIAVQRLDIVGIDFYSLPIDQLLNHRERITLLGRQLEHLSIENCKHLDDQFLKGWVYYLNSSYLTTLELIHEEESESMEEHEYAYYNIREENNHHVHHHYHGYKNNEMMVHYNNTHQQQQHQHHHQHPQQRQQQQQQRLKKFHPKPPDVTDEGLAEVLTIMPQIRSLTLVGLPRITGAFLEIACRTLVTLPLTRMRIIWCTNFSYNGVQYLDRESLLQLKYFQFRTQSPFPRALRKIIRRIVRAAPFLNEINLMGECFDSSTIQIIGTECKHLQQFSLFNSQVESLIILIENCNQLQSLEIIDCPESDEESFILALTSLSELHTLSYAGSSQLTGMEVLQVNHINHTLQRLVLYCCEHLSDEGLRAIVRTCPSLQELCLSDCSLLTDFSMEAIMQHCSNLRILQLSLCDRITNNGIIAILTNCSALEDIDISSANGIVLDELLRHMALMSISGIITKLKAIDISGNIMNECDSILEFITSHLKLEILTIDDDIAHLIPSSESLISQENIPLYQIVKSSYPKLQLNVRVHEESIYETENETDEENENEI